jgi:murein DD-endopeptidase MepM/ murein hydrolase activator NlpD
MIWSLALVTSCARASATIATAPVASIDAEYFEAHPLMVPVEGIRPEELRDSFNDTRDGGRTHRATDILAPRGTPVVAAIDGEVLRLRQNSAGGITAYLVDSERRYVYYYAHLDHYSDQITEGLRVQQGFVIGYVGTSGNAPPDTPHLHFQAMRLEPGQRDWWNGTPVDVRPFITRTGRVME